MNLLYSAAGFYSLICCLLYMRIYALTRPVTCKVIDDDSWFCRIDLFKIAIDKYIYPYKLISYGYCYFLFVYGFLLAAVGSATPLSCIAQYSSSYVWCCSLCNGRCWQHISIAARRVLLVLQTAMRWAIKYRVLPVRMHAKVTRIRKLTHILQTNKYQLKS